MIVMMMILVVFAATWAIPPRGRWTPQARWRVGLAVAMAVAGITHLANPTPFLQHLPEWVPLRSGVVVVSGLLEIAFGAALLVRSRWRVHIGLALAAFLVAVFPANIYVAVAGIDVQGQPDGIYAWIRLLFQPLYVWLALWTTGASIRTALQRLRPGVVAVPPLTAHLTHLHMR